MKQDLSCSAGFDSYYWCSSYCDFYGGLSSIRTNSGAATATHPKRPPVALGQLIDLQNVIIFDNQMSLRHWARAATMTAKWELVEQTIGPTYSSLSHGLDSVRVT